MVSIFVAGAMLAEVQPKIVAASLFKNGYSMVLREVPASGSGAEIVEIPSPSFGSLWFTTSSGLTLKGVRVTHRVRESDEPLGTLGEYLRANKGKAAHLTLRISANLTVVAGTIADVVGELVFIRLSTGQPGAGLAAYRVADVVTVSVEGEPALTRKGTQNQRVLQLQTEGTGKVYLLGLEYGLAWAPGYTIDITNPKKLTLSAKSTVLNDLGDFSGIELRFVTGFPNVPWANLREPLLSGDALSSFVSMLQQIGMPASGFAGRRDAQFMSNQVANVPAGAFGGEPMQITGEGGEMAEDLFFYRQPGVTMKRNDRAFFLLFQAEADYSHLYTLDIPNTINEQESYNPGAQRQVPYDVWHTIQFKNTSKQPLTTGPATVYKDQQIMGQDTVTYTSAGSEVNVKMSKALDVQSDVNEEETTRERAALRTPNYGTFDLVTVKGTISLRNVKSEPVRLRITKHFTGDLVAADAMPKATKLAKGLREVNARTKLEWNLTLAAGKSQTVTYTYKIYVRV